LQVLLKEKAINSLALVEEQLALQREHAHLQQQFSKATAAVAELQQQAQQACDRQAAAEAAKQAAEQQCHAVRRDKQRTERQLQATEKKLGTAVKVRGKCMVQQLVHVQAMSVVDSAHAHVLHVSNAMSSASLILSSAS
jgi:hypothetical protein